MLYLAQTLKVQGFRGTLYPRINRRNLSAVIVVSMLQIRTWHGIVVMK